MGHWLRNVRRGLVAAAAFSAATPASAGGLKGLPDPGVSDHNLVIGPSMAAAVTSRKDAQPALGLDVTYSYSLLWASLGARFISDEQWTSLPYGEVGIWLLANVGAGCTVVHGGSHSGQVAPHLFLGLPIPVSPAKTNSFHRTLIVEPYYRPTFWEGDTLHEAGLLVKIVAWGRKSRPRYESPVVPLPAPRSDPPLVDPPTPGQPEPAPQPAPEEPPHAPMPSDAE